LLRVLSELWSIANAFAEAVDDFFSWRDDWNRTWSPVSYFLAIFAAFVIIVLLIAFGAPVWGHIRGLFGA